jgi:hypothetical protein
MAEPDFWSVVGLAELQVFKALAAGSLAEAVDGVLAELRDLQERVPAPSQWDSVHAEARFVLLPYLALDLPGEERCAVAQLLEVLEDFAGRDA